MMDILEIKRKLHGNTLAVCQHLLPGGVREGSEWRAGSLSGDVGKSLGVHLSGEKSGVWSDFSSGESGGDLIDLWRESREINLATALDEIKSWLGIEATEFSPNKRQHHKRPERPKCQKPVGPVFRYLTEERLLTASAIEAYKVGEKGRLAVFPAMVDGELLFGKLVGIDPDEKGKTKKLPIEKDLSPHLIGWQAIPENIREVTICEGEIDALTLWDYGYPALSVPFGGGGGAKQAWIENEFDRLSRFETIFLCFDNDDQGQAAVKEIAPRLGLYRCRVVHLPYKDANKTRQMDVGTEAIDKVFASADTIAPSVLRAASDFRSDVHDLFYPPFGEEPGYRLPWGKGSGIRFRPGEVSLWTGGTGTGKSQMIGHVCVDTMDQGAKICIASFEMKASMLLKRMVKQTGDTDRPTTGFLNAIFDWMVGKCWIFDEVGKKTIAEVLDVFDYARCRYGADVFVLDSFMRLKDVSPEDYNSQEKAIYRLVEWAVSNSVHLHVVAHSRKSQNHDAVPELDDVKGASEIASNVFNVIAIWRNRKHEQKIKDAKQARDMIELDKLQKTPGVVVNVAKQRNGDWEGRFGLWFDVANYRYHSSEDGSKRYVKYDKLTQSAS